MWPTIRHNYLVVVVCSYIHSKSNRKWFFSFSWIQVLVTSCAHTIQIPMTIGEIDKNWERETTRTEKTNEIYDPNVDTIGKGQKRRKETKEILMWNARLLAGPIVERAKRKLNVGVHSWMKRTQLVEHTHNVTMHKILQRRRDGGQRRRTDEKWTRTQTSDSYPVAGVDNNDTRTWYWARVARYDNT